MANLLHEVITRIPKVKNIIKSSALVGHGRKHGTQNGTAVSEGMNFREQCEIIGNFRYSFFIFSFFSFCFVIFCYYFSFYCGDIKNLYEIGGMN